MAFGPESRRPTALVVEDEALISLALEETLTDEGYRVLTARTCNEALAAIAAEPVSIALLDYWLETQSADEVAAELKDRGIPFAICTGSMADDMKERFPETIILGKPFAPGALEAVMQSLREAGSAPRV
jgi:DNA-binding response OmpR family regulator